MLEARSPILLPFRDPLDLPERAALPAVARIIENALRARSRPISDGTRAKQAHWDAAYFGLERVAAFRELALPGQAEVINACGQGLLAEALRIEKIGMSFTAKMSLLSETAQDRALYSLFASDEATHWSQLQRFASSDTLAAQDDDPFATLISKIVREADRPVLVFLIQVVLEGWGISHYRGLARHCLTDELKETLAGILRDEANHHGSGVALFRYDELSKAQIEYVEEALVHFLAMVGMGPQGVVSALSKRTTELSRGQTEQVFKELDGELDAARKMRILTGLMQQSGAGALVERLEAWKALRPLTANQCAALACGGENAG